MRKGRIFRLARVIEQQENTTYASAHGFYMGTCQHPCGTPACISGWAQHMWPTANDKPLAEILGLTDTQQANRLIVPMSSGTAYFSAQPGERSHITSKHAAAVLRHLARTGDVDWSVGA